MSEIELKPDPNDPNYYKVGEPEPKPAPPVRQYQRPAKRPKRADEEAVQRAIMERWGPHKILDVVEQAHVFAYKTKSWKGLMEVARFLAEYTVGKPKQALNMTHTATPEDWAEFFRDKDVPEAEVFGTFGEPEDGMDGSMADDEGVDGDGLPE